jgi:hypothetical protein
MTPEMEALVGKIIGEDITEEELVEMFPEFDVKILNMTTLALANFKPERLRVWHDNDKRICKVIPG